MRPKLQSSEAWWLKESVGLSNEHIPSEWSHPLAAVAKIGYVCSFHVALIHWVHE